MPQGVEGRARSRLRSRQGVRRWALALAVALVLTGAFVPWWAGVIVLWPRWQGAASARGQGGSACPCAAPGMFLEVAGLSFTPERGYAGISHMTTTFVGAVVQALALGRTLVIPSRVWLDAKHNFGVEVESRWDSFYSFALDPEVGSTFRLDAGSGMRNPLWAPVPGLFDQDCMVALGNCVIFRGIDGLRPAAPGSPRTALDLGTMRALEVPSSAVITAEQNREYQIIVSRDDAWRGSTYGRRSLVGRPYAWVGSYDPATHRRPPGLTLRPSQGVTGLAQGALRAFGFVLGGGGELYIVKVRRGDNLRPEFFYSSKNGPLGLDGKRGSHSYTAPDNICLELEAAGAGKASTVACGLRTTCPSSEISSEGASRGPGEHATTIWSTQRCGS
mmetsp:Transcript_50042/g.160139  ORF Transcript_50042/g.160139 Transcript_50042/m.160139 type:complete len:389 (+) Transcript_50042:106-1272(+)